MSIKKNLRKLAELGIGITAVTTLALAGCGGGSGSGGSGGNSGGSNTPVSGLVSIFAGTSGSLGISDGTGTAARFIAPANLTTDGTNLYVADFTANNIRKINIATGAVTVFAGSTTGASGVSDGTATGARFYQPDGITTDGVNLYVSDSGNNNIRQISISTGVVTTIAGSITGASGVAIDATPGTSARFFGPGGICKIGTNLYVVDFTNNSIRKIDLSANNAVTTLAGNYLYYGYTNNLAGASAVFNEPEGLTTDGVNLYVTDSANNDVRKINPATGMVTIVAGGNFMSAASGVGSADGTGTAARFNSPYGITYDGNGNLYVSDTRNHTIRKIVVSTGAVTTLAGTAGASGVTDATGASARFNMPWGILAVSGVLYVGDTLNGSIRKVQQ